MIAKTKDIEKSNLLDIIALILGIFILFMQPLKNLNSVFSLIDECVLLLTLLIFVIITLKTGKIKKRELTIFAVFFIFICIGIIGNWKSNLNIKFSSIITDIFSYAKFFIMLICGSVFFERTNNNKKNISIFAKIVRINIAIALPLAILNQFNDLGMRDDYRRGLYCFNYIYDTAAIFSWYCLMYLLILSIDLLNNKNKKNYIFIALNILLWLFTGRSRGMAFCLIYIMLFWGSNFFAKKGKKFKFKLSYILILGLIGVAVAWKQFIFYFTTSTEARFILLNTGIKICIKYIPFGAGLGTFGTFAAQKYYSPLYNFYGLNKIYGFTFDNPLYLTDNFWPAVVGETGILGLIVYAILLYLTFKYMYQKLALNDTSKKIITFFIITVLCSSIATTIFTQNATIGDIFYLCMIPGVIGGKKDE